MPRHIITLLAVDVLAALACMQFASSVALSSLPPHVVQAAVAGLHQKPACQALSVAYVAGEQDIATLPKPALPGHLLQSAAHWTAGSKFKAAFFQRNSVEQGMKYKATIPL